MAGDIQLAYNYVVQACNDAYIGYSQGKRETIKLGGTTRTYCDCSSLLSWALTKAGFFTKNPWFTTANEVSKLLSAGFVEVPIDGDWKAGDIIWRVGHTEMVYKGRRTMGAHTSSTDFPNQVSIRTSNSSPSSYTKLFRYGNGAEGGDIGIDISIYVVSAMIGNAWQESGVNPAQWQQGHAESSTSTVNGNAFGIFQMDGGRRRNELQWLLSNGYDINSGIGQLKWMLQENESDAWIVHYGNIRSFHDFLTSNSTDLTMLTTAFCRNYERAGVENLDYRIRMAERTLTYLQQHGADTGLTWHGNITYITDKQGWDNAVLIYQFLCLNQSGGGGEGLSGTLRNGMARELYRRIYIHR